jgi:hypothetical protein
MKKLFALPVIGLILGAVAIATEIKTTDLIPVGQQLSGAIVSCIQTAVEQREIALLSSFVNYQDDNLTTLITRKDALLLALEAPTKSEIKRAISAAWKTYKKSVHQHKLSLKASRNLAWSEYTTQVESCK